MENNDRIKDYLDKAYVRSHSDETVKTYRNVLKKKFNKFLTSKYQIDFEELISLLS